MDGDALWRLGKAGEGMRAFAPPFLHPPFSKANRPSRSNEQIFYGKQEEGSSALNRGEAHL